MIIFKKPEILAHLHAYRENRPGQFWGGMAIVGTSLFGMVAAFATAPTSLALQADQHIVVEQLALPRTVLAPPANTPNVFIREEKLRPGDTLSSLWTRLSLQDKEALAFLRKEKDGLNLVEMLKPGMKVTARSDDKGQLLALSLPVPERDSEKVLERRDGHLHVVEKSLQLETRILMKSGEVTSGLFAAADAVGLPDAAASQLSEIFDEDVDFHGDLRRGDRFSVVYEMVYSRGEPLRTGRVLAAEIVSQGRSYRALSYRGNDGQLDYYSPDGRPLKKAFLRSPLEFSRISSGFTNARFHPVLKDWRAHKGVDFSAPIGTGVKATADGVVDVAGVKNGYGNVVILHHQGSYSTVYGHLSGFGPGIRPGTRVRQGEVIGYVGMTGWTTGPHLHYEFRINDEPQDPLSVALPGALPLPGSQLSAFKTKAAPLLARLDQVKGINLATLN